MKGNRSLILSLALLFSALNTVQGNKDIAVRNSRRVKSPRVMDDIGCIFKYNTNSLCFTQNPPTLRAGWEFDQTYSSLEGVDFWKYHLGERCIYARWFCPLLSTQRGWISDDILYHAGWQFDWICKFNRGWNYDICITDNHMDRNSRGQFANDFGTAKQARQSIKSKRKSTRAIRN